MNEKTLDEQVKEKSSDEIFIRRKQIPKMFGIGYSTVALLSRSDEAFPLPIQVSGQIKVWSVDELKDYFSSRPRGERLK
jgi:predicted DNA-binding transcriptional regulator AlpA